MFVFKVTNLQNGKAFIGYSKYDYTSQPHYKLQQNVKYSKELKNCIKERKYELSNLGNYPDPLCRVIRNDLVKSHKTMKPYGYNTDEQTVYDTQSCLLMKKLLDQNESYVYIGRRIGCDQKAIRQIEEWIDDWAEQYEKKQQDAI